MIIKKKNGFINRVDNFHNAMQEAPYYLGNKYLDYMYNYAYFNYYILQGYIKLK